MALDNENFELEEMLYSARVRITDYVESIKVSDELTQGYLHDLLQVAASQSMLQKYISTETILRQQAEELATRTPTGTKLLRDLARHPVMVLLNIPSARGMKPYNPHDIFG